MWILQPKYEGSVFDRFSTRRSRRLLVLACLATLLALPLVAWLTRNGWIVAPIILPVLAMISLLEGSTRGVMSLKSAELDERQRSVRDGIYRSSFRIGITFAFLGGSLLATISAWMQDETDFSAWNDQSVLFLGASLAIFMLMFSIPLVLLAWRLPDEVRDES